MRRRAWALIASVGGWLGVSHDAGAVIPFEAQITPGELRGISHHGGDPWEYGYWEYLPAAFDINQPDELYPLIVFLGGIGEFDDVPVCPGNTDLCATSDCGSDGLCRNLHWGPQLLMRNGIWDDVARPFIMISPQNPVPTSSAQEWNVGNLDGFLDWLVANYPIDPRRLYLMGMSQGGRGTFQYTAVHSRRFAAVAPMPGGVVGGDVTCHFEDTALWIFHGEDDQNGNLGNGTFNPCAVVEYMRIYENPDLYPGFAACADAVGSPRPEGRITMFYDVGHFAWVEAADPIFEGFPAAEWATDQACGSADVEFREYSAALDADGVYSWFLDLDRPVVVAPDDLGVLDDVGTLPLTAVVTDDDTVTFEWTQVSGPAATLADADQPTVQVSDLVADASYTFQVFVVDADQQWDLDEVTVDVTAAPEPGTTGTGGSTGSGSGGASSSDGGASDSGTAAPGSSGSPPGETTGEVSGGSGSTGTGAGTTGADDTAGTDAGPGGGAASNSGGPGGGPGSGGPSGSGTGDDTTGGAGENATGGDGCSCRSTSEAPRLWAALWLGLVGLGRRRRSPLLPGAEVVGRA